MSINSYARETRIPIGRSQVISKNDVLVGKDVLELLTGAMYVDPLTIYREYVQNATDGIEEARRAGLLGEDLGRIDLNIDVSERVIRIRDNGASIQQNEFIPRLLSIGISDKRGKHLCGFRGIGRLAGLAYCQEVAFRGRASAHEAVTEVVFNARKLRELLNSNDVGYDLQTAVSEIATSDQNSSKSQPPRFFEVELRKVLRIKNDVLLNPDAVEQYLSQVAPVPFRQDFEYSNRIEDLFLQHGVAKPIELVINGNLPVRRPHQMHFELRSNVTDRFSNIQFYEIPGIDGGSDAVGWILDHSYFGAFPKSLNVGGLRLRAGNIQVGESDILAALFTEPRFNSWCVGEFHIVNDRILPNGRRDEFEHSTPYINLQSHIAKIATDVSRICRTRSAVRNLMRYTSQNLGKIETDLGVLRAIPHNFPFREKHQKALGELIRKQETNIQKRFPIGSEKEALLKRVTELARKLDRTASLKTKSTVLHRIAPAKKRAYSEVLSAIYEVTSDVSVAHDYVNKILKQLRRK
jgi:molecular chaperone HtpG